MYRRWPGKGLVVAPPPRSHGWIGVVAAQRMAHSYKDSYKGSAQWSVESGVRGQGASGLTRLKAREGFFSPGSDCASFVRNRTVRSMQYSWLQTMRQLRQ